MIFKRWCRCYYSKIFIDTALLFINLSISSEIVPSEFKMAQVNPLFNKPDWATIRPHWVCVEYAELGMYWGWMNWTVLNLAQNMWHVWRDSWTNKWMQWQSSNRDSKKICLLIISFSIGTHRGQEQPRNTVFVQALRTNGWMDRPSYTDALLTDASKNGPCLNVGNYRPVSILPVLSKILEHTFDDLLNEYLRKKYLLYEFQSGFGRVSLWIHVWWILMVLSSLRAVKVISLEWS